MKRLIRQKVFETNSSSAHSLSLGLSESKDFVFDSLYPDEEGNIILTGGEFGWEYEKYNDALTKANYAAVSTFYGLDPDLLKEVILEQTGANDVILNISSDDDSPNWSYIDHQSVGNCPRTKDELRDFIFNKNSWLFTGNDNQTPAPNFYEVEKYYNKENGVEVEPVAYKYQIVFEDPSLKVMNLKFINYPTKEDLKSMISYFDFKYNKTLKSFEINENFWSSQNDYYESYYLDQEDPEGNRGCIILADVKKVSEFNDTLKEIKWSYRAEKIKEFLEINTQYLMMVEFNIIEL